MSVAIVGDLHIGNQVNSRNDDYFGTCLEKLNQVLSENEEILFLGDFFNTPTLPIEKIQALYSLLKNWNRAVYAIRGNHDVYYMNNDLSKTALGLLALTGVVKIIDDNETVELKHYKVTALPLNFKDIAPISVESAGKNHILVGHHFYGLSCSDSLTTDYVRDNFKGFSHLILGHDHKSYEDELVGDIKIVRPGSALRNACTDYNMERTPYYLTWDGSNFTKKFFKAEPAEKIFTKSAFAKTVQKEKQFLETLDALLESRKNKSDFKTNRVRSLKGIIQTLDIPEASMNYLVRLHERLNITFT